MGPSAAADEDAQEPLETATNRTPLPLTRAQSKEYVGTFYSAELDAIYRISASDDGVFVAIEQELPIPVFAAAKDRFEFEFQPAGWSSPEIVELDFRRSEGGEITGFLLSAWTERGIVFDRIELPTAGEVH